MGRGPPANCTRQTRQTISYASMQWVLPGTAGIALHIHTVQLDYASPVCLYGINKSRGEQHCNNILSALLKAKKSVDLFFLNDNNNT